MSARTAFAPWSTVKSARKLAEAAHPGEACGLLTGRGGGEAFHIDALHPSPNVAPPDARDRFEIDPDFHLSLQRACREDGRMIIGVWHSHPNGRLGPSPSDIDGAMDVGFLWFISSRAADEYHHRCYIWLGEDQGFEDVALAFLHGL